LLEDRWDDVVPFIRLNWKDEGDVEGVRDRFLRIRSMDVANWKDARVMSRV